MRFILLAILAVSAATGAAGLPGAVLCQSPAATMAPTEPSTEIMAVGPIGIIVSDLDRAVEFYTSVLAFEPLDEQEVFGDSAERLRGLFGARARIARLRLGEETIELTQYLAPEGRPIPADSRSNDRWFQHIAIVVSDIDVAYQHLRQHNARHASSGPQILPAWNTNAAGIGAFYFKDPDGHVLEVIRFPPGKGNPRWQLAKGRLFLGIDHTAVVVEDTDRALAFYRDTLGLRLAGGSENYGTEQEHLNNIFGARLRITTLTASRGPGVELLEYLAPTDGRDYPADTRVNDLWNWYTTLHAASPAELERHLLRSKQRWISAGLVGDAANVGMMLRDPDGHALLIVPPGTPAR